MLSLASITCMERDGFAAMPDCQVLLFKIRGDDYGLDISKVSSVLRNDARVTRVPGTAPHVMGVINLRGEILPIVDTRIRLEADARRIRLGADARRLRLEADAPGAGGIGEAGPNARGPNACEANSYGPAASQATGCEPGAGGVGGAGAGGGPDAESRIVVVKSDGVSVGLIVDSVSEVVRVPESDIESPASLSGALPAEDVGGIVRAGGRAATLLNAESFMQA
jgi:chemotaxis signal transduction protein